MSAAVTSVLAPALLAISHGTSSPAGQAAVSALVVAVAARLPDTIVRLGHVDVQQPDVAASLDAIPADTPVVIVPLLLLLIIAAAVSSSSGGGDSM